MNDHRNYFMFNLHESMGPGRDQTRDPLELQPDMLQTALRCLVQDALPFTNLDTFSSPRAPPLLLPHIQGLFFPYPTRNAIIIFCLFDYNAVTPVRLEPAAPQSTVKHSTTEPLRSNQLISTFYSTGWCKKILDESDFLPFRIITLSNQASR